MKNESSYLFEEKVLVFSEFLWGYVECLKTVTGGKQFLVTKNYDQFDENYYKNENEFSFRPE